MFSTNEFNSWEINKENLIEAVFELIEAIGFTDETEEGHNKLKDVQV